jgi:aminopeptidase 2
MLMTMRTGATVSEALWVWAQKRWEDIEAKLFASLGIFGVIVGIMIRGLSSRKHLGEIEQFFKGKDTSNYDKQLALVLDELKVNVAWVERDGDDVKRWLKENGYYASD